MTNTDQRPKRWTDFDPYLTAEDLAGRAVTLTITAVGTAQVYDQREKREVAKPTLHFEGKRKYLILSPHNRKTLLGIFGNDCQACIGKQITLRVESIKAFGDDKPTIRLAAATAPAVTHKEMSA